MVELKTISKNFKYHKTTLNVLDQVDFEVKANDFTCIVGRSGSGKSTLLNIISGLIKPSSGKVILDGKEVKPYFDPSSSQFRSEKIGFVFQHFNLIPYHTILENVVIPLKFSSLPIKQHKKRGIDVLKEMGIEDKIDCYPNMLSGGQLQRVAIARSLIKNPKLIIADEPTGNLDDKTAGEIIDIFMELNEKQNVAFIVVTHDHNIINCSHKQFELKNKKLQRLHS